MEDAHDLDIYRPPNAYLKPHGKEDAPIDATMRADEGQPDLYANAGHATPVSADCAPTWIRRTRKCRTGN